MEKKLESMRDILEHKESQLNEVLVHAQIDPSVVGQVRGRLEDLIENKNQAVRDLEMELVRISRSQDHLVKATEDKIKKIKTIMIEKVNKKSTLPLARKDSG